MIEYRRSDLATDSCLPIIKYYYGVSECVDCKRWRFLSFVARPTGAAGREGQRLVRAENIEQETGNDESRSLSDLKKNIRIFISTY
jgi:hypothetical protein